MSLGQRDVLSVEQKTVLDNITSKANSLERDMEITKFALQEECDRLVKERDVIMKQNVPLWGILAGRSSNTAGYSWAQRKLEQNEQHIKDIEIRLARLKELEQEISYSVSS